VRSLRVSSTLALRGRLSRRSEISSLGDWVGTTRSFGLDCEGFPGLEDLFDLVTGTCLGSTVTLGADFAVLTFLLVFVTSLV
jgi:hypothetical protein